MISLLRGFSQLRPLKTLHATGQHLFSKHLLVTNTVITMCLSGTGDALQQHYEKLYKRQQHWNRSRTGKICVTGLVIGPICHYWYVVLDRFIPGQSLRVVAKKVLIDQIVFSPVNISVFLLMIGALEGSKMVDVLNDLKTKGWDLFKAEWLIWPPAQAVNFCFVPLKYRLLYDNSISLGFDYYYSYVQFVKYKCSDTDSEGDIITLPEAKTFCCKIPEYSYRT